MNSQSQVQFLIRSTVCFMTVLLANAHVRADPLAHRKSLVTVRVEDTFGNPVPNATVDLQMTRHEFRFGTQIRDRFISITESEFNSLNTSQKQWLLPDQTAFGAATRYTPTYQDVQNYQNAVLDHFNYVVPTVGMQWLVLNGNGPSVPDAALSFATLNNLEIGAASVVWERDQWPTPTQYRSDSNPNPQTFYNALVNDRLGPNGVMARFSSTGAGANITDWKLLNEPLHETYFSDTFIGAGIYQDQIEAWADYFIQADTLRPDADLQINDFNILNWNGNGEAERYRDLVNDLLAAGAPIDSIGVQAHMSRADVTKNDIKQRLDILAQTGLPIEITEFDSRDDPGQPFPSYVPLTAQEQEQIFRDLLEASFEHPSVDKFIMWGFWDPGHWRYNGPLYDDNWNVKPEAAPWFDLVEGDWQPDLTDLTLNANGEWSLNGGLFQGEYDFTVDLSGNETSFEDVVINQDGNIVLVIAVDIPGDYNGNGTVGTEDFFLWRDSFSSTSNLAADGNNDGVVDAADYTIWRDAFSASAASAISVPEPNSLTVVLVLMLTYLFKPNRRIALPANL